jgi:hypothetical protein
VRLQAIEAAVSDSDAQKADDSYELKSPLNTLLAKKREIHWVNRLL